MEKEFKPLLAVGLHYIHEQNTTGRVIDMNAIQKVLDNFINGLISFPQAEKKYQKLVGSTLPLIKINEILKITDKPLPKRQLNPILANLPPKLINTYKKKTHPWVEEEDKRLLKGIHIYGLNNWAAVSNFVGNSRTKAQCSQRWFRGLDPRISKVLWTTEEDKKLKDLVEKYGDRSWTKIASKIGSRSDAQCRYHYRQINKETNDKVNQTIIRNEVVVPPISSAPNPEIVNKLYTITSSSSFPERAPTNKIPSIESFSEDISHLPNHLRFQFDYSGTLPTYFK